MMGNLLYTEINDYNFNKKNAKRRVSVVLSVQNLDAKVDRGKRKTIHVLR